MPLQGVPSLFGGMRAASAAYSFPQNGILDNFNRANEGPPPSASWTSQFIPVGGGGDAIKVVSNVAEGVGAGYNSQVWGTTPANNQESYITGFTAGYWGVLGRLSNINTASVTGYEARARDAGTNVFLYRWDDSGTRPTLTSVAQSWSSGDSLGLSIVGSAITVYFKAGAGAWSAIIGPFTDATYASGGIGMLVESASDLDNFGGGSIV